MAGAQLRQCLVRIFHYFLGESREIQFPHATHIQIKSLASVEVCQLELLNNKLSPDVVAFQSPVYLI